jgi:hypothetical protein
MCLCGLGKPKACAAPTGLRAPREYRPAAPRVGYGVSSLRGLNGDALRCLLTGGNGKRLDKCVGGTV